MSNTSIASRLRGVFTKAGLAAFVILLAALAPPGAGAEVVTNAVAPAGQAFIKWTGGNVPLVKTYRNPLVLPDGASLDGVEAVFGPAIYVATNGVAEADGSSWENATTLVNAFAIAVDGDVIVISNGTYNAGATLAADRKAITMRGLTGQPRRRDPLRRTCAQSAKCRGARQAVGRRRPDDHKGVDADGWHLRIQRGDFKLPCHRLHPQ